MSRGSSSITSSLVSIRWPRPLHVGQTAYPACRFICWRVLALTTCVIVTKQMLQPWLLLLLSLPPRPSSLRVRAWRRLKALGAVALKSGAYLLPDSPDRYEQFQWLAQEVEKDRGEATLLKVDRVENMKQPEVVRLFQEARDADYADLTDRYR